MLTGHELEAIANIEEMITGTLSIYETQFKVLDMYEQNGEDVRAMRAEAEASLKSTIESFRSAIDGIRKTAEARENEAGNTI